MNLKVFFTIFCSVFFINSCTTINPITGRKTYSGEQAYKEFLNQNTQNINHDPRINQLVAKKPYKMNTLPVDTGESLIW